MRGLPRVENELVMMEEDQVLDAVIQTGNDGRYVTTFAEHPLSRLVDHPREEEENDPNENNDENNDERNNRLDNISDDSFED
jgi:hypothetical protein